MSKKATPVQPPREGGSFVIGKDGKVVREEFTQHPGDPGHAANMPAQSAVEPPLKDA